MNWSQFLRDSALGAAAYYSFNAAKGVESLNYKFEEYQKKSAAQIESLRSDINKGFARISFELAVQSEIFKNVLEVLKNKRKTEAEELKRLGITALRNNWIDDAIKDFDSSIEFNRYDYQVYYLLAKCYFFKGNGELKNKNLELAYHYSSEDPDFRLFVVLDIVASLAMDRDYDEAKRVIAFAEETIETKNDKTTDRSPLLLAKVYIDFLGHNVNDSTLGTISELLDTYQGSDPSKIISTIIALSQECDNETRLKIENLFNLKKLEITLNYGKKVFIYLSNIYKFLSEAKQMDKLIKIPSSVISKHFPTLRTLSEIMAKTQSAINSESSLSIDSFDLYIYLMPILHNLEELIIEDVKWARQWNNNIFEVMIKPTYNFDVGKDDKVLIQLELKNKALLSLTMHNLIMVDTDKKTYQYDLFDIFSTLSFDSLDSDSDYHEKYFFIRDRVSEKIIQLSTSSLYSNDWIIDNKPVNLLDLIKGRAASLIIDYSHMVEFNSHLKLLNTVLNTLNLNDREASEPETSSIISKPVDSNIEDIEFLD